MRAAILRFVPPPDHVVGASLVSVVQANALNITLGALITVALHNFIARRSEKSPLRSLLGWVLPVPVAMLFAGIAPVGGLAAAGIAAATVAAYLVSWFGPGFIHYVSERNA